jgi:MFS family permease
MSRVWRIWAVLILFALGTSLITPLIPLYQERDGFGDTVVALFMICYVVALVPSMLTLGQLSDRIGRKPVLIGGLLVLGAAQAYLALEPSLAGLLVARGLQGLAMGAFGGTCTAFLIDATPLGRRAFVSTLAAISIRGGLGFGPGIAGVIAQYAAQPLSLPFEIHLVALVVALGIVLTLPETVTERSRRPLTLRLEVPAAERAVFWRVLVPSGMLFSLFDGVALSMIPVFLRRDIGVDNLAVIGASGFLVLVSGAVTQAVLYRVPPEPAIGWGLVVAAAASGGVVLSAPLESATLTLVAVAVTGGAAGMVFKGGADLATLIAPPQDRGKLISAYYVACYLGGFSVPLLVIGVLSDLMGLTAALACLTGAAMIGAIWTWGVGMRSVKDLRRAGSPVAG